MSVWIEKLQALPAGRDNGCAGAQGQPAGLAFPKAFVEVYRGFCWGYQRKRILTDRWRSISSSATT
jgi:hypothetical protein